MNSIKKHLSILMTAVMILSLVPFSSFAVDPALVGPVTTYTQADKNKEVKLTLNLGKFQDLKTGTALFQLSNAKLATVAGSAVATVAQGTTSKSSPDLTFVTTSGAALTGGESFFNLKINTPVPANNVADIIVIVTLKVDFSNANGEVKLTVSDGETGIGNGSAVIATDVVPEAKDMDVSVSNKDAKIGPAGGTLAPITIQNLGKLSTTTADNSLVVTLPAGFQFTPATKVELSSGTASVTYSTDKDQMIIKGLNDKTAFAKITPVIILQGKNSAKSGPVNASFELKVNDRTIIEKDTVIGQLADYGITMTAVEKGKKEIPTLTKGQAKTVEITIDAVDGTLSSGQSIDFELDGAKMVFGKLKVTQPSGITLSAPKSAGTKDENKVAGLEVYADNSFTIRTTAYNVTKIKLEVDLVAEDKSPAQINMTAFTLRDYEAKTQIAKTVSALKATASPITVVKGKVSNLPNITLTEPAVNTLQKGDKIYLRLNYVGSDSDKGQNLAFNDAKEIKIATTNNLVIDSAVLDKQENILILTVGSRSFNGPGTITLSGIKGFITNKAIMADVKLEVKVNNSVEDEITYFTLSDSLEGAKTQFVIGSNSYLSNGVTKTLVTAPYIKGTGYTMLPVRALGESLGLSANWDNLTKVATFASEGKVAIVKIGENFITVNGMKQTLNAPAEIRNGSTMIELRSLAKAFDVNLDWNAATKTVTVN